MTQNPLPLVTIAVITYRHEQYVRSCLDSIARQTYPRIELIVIDDNSPDATGKMLQEWAALEQIRHLRLEQHNEGLCKRLNQAFALSSGTFFASISGDDFMEHDRIANQVEAFLEGGDRLGVVYSDATLIDDRGVDLGETYLNPSRRPATGDVFRDLIGQNFVPAPSALIRVESLRAVGPYDESMRFEDYDMWLRLSRMCDFGFVPSCLVSHRKHTGSLSVELGPELQEGAILALRKQVGIDAISDQLIAQRVAQLACAGYLNGGHSSLLRHELLVAVKGKAANRSVVLAVLAWARVPGGLVHSSRSLLRRCRTRLGITRRTG